MKNDEFSLEEFIARVERLKTLGPIGKLMESIPGMGAVKRQLARSDQAISEEVERFVARIRAIYGSMTRKEHARSEIIDENRRRRIARGAGVELVDVARFLIEFDRMRDVTKVIRERFSSGGFEDGS